MDNDVRESDFLAVDGVNSHRVGSNDSSCDDRERTFIFYNNVEFLVQITFLF